MVARVVSLLLLAPVTARAVDCSTVTLDVGKPLTEDAAECLRREVVALEHEVKTCAIKRQQCLAERDACEATALITCPPVEPQVGPVIFAGALGILVGAVATLAIILGVGR